jgi:dihydropteroate synthase
MTLPIIREPAPRRGFSFAQPTGITTHARPVDLIYGCAADAAVGDGSALWLVGGPIAFRSLELIRRDDDAVRIHTVPVRALNPGWLPAGLLDRLTAARQNGIGGGPGTPALMGVVNVTPDSFSDGGRFANRDAAIAQGRRLAAEGADILDIGGESTRPGAAVVSVEEEIDRVVPVIEVLARDGHRISVDTRKAPVMRAALDAGAVVVNDVSALAFDPDAPSLLAGEDCPVILMHMRGEPGTMQDDPRYDCAPLEVFDELAARVDAAEAAGIARSRIAVDPGFGFAKTADHNIQATAWLALLHGLGCSVLFGASRKSSIARLSRGEGADDRLPGSIALALAAMDQGAQVIRVHDVAETAQAFAVRRAFHAAS